MRDEDVAAALGERVRSAFIGQPQTVELLLAALGARAHVLLEGPPGTAKTLLAWSVARSVGIGFKRVQLTPDLMPSDLIGTSVWLPHQGRFEFRAGPIFADVVLADELNRAPPKTQAALLEAMQERQVTFDGETHSLGSFFWVVATQNPLEQEGTYPLPESELDRFALKLTVRLPDAQDERRMLLLHRERGDAMLSVRDLDPVLDRDGLLDWQQRVERVYVADPVIDYIQALVGATREQSDLIWGAGPRASLALLGCGRALALVRGRSYVIPDDIRDLVFGVLAHRLRLAPEAQVAGLSMSRVIERILSLVPVPTVHRP